MNRLHMRPGTECLVAIEIKGMVIISLKEDDGVTWDSHAMKAGQPLTFTF